MEQQPIVQLKNLSKVINGKQIIDDLTLDIYPGQITGFLGPNGSGKTTTIRLMTGLMSLTGGEVIIDGVSLQKDYENAIKNVGVIVENPEMYKYLSGYKNLLHFTRMHTNISKERIDEVVRQVGLENRIHEKVSTYSLGMRQRLGLAQSLLHNPKFLILDEPFSGLDPVNKDLLKEAILLLKEKGMTILFSSHQMENVEELCDHLCLLKRGKPLFAGSLLDLKKQYGKTKLTVRTHFTQEQLAALPGVVQVKADKDQFILTLEQEESAKSIFETLSNGAYIEKFSLDYLSLDEIFKDKVGEQHV